MKQLFKISLHLHTVISNESFCLDFIILGTYEGSNHKISYCNQQNDKETQLSLQRDNATNDHTDTYKDNQNDNNKIADQ